MQQYCLPDYQCNRVAERYTSWAISDRFCLCLLQKTFHKDLTEHHGSFHASQLPEQSTCIHLLGPRPQLQLLASEHPVIPLTKWGHRLHFTHFFDEIESTMSGEHTSHFQL